MKGKTTTTTKDFTTKAWRIVAVMLVVDIILSVSGCASITPIETVQAAQTEAVQTEAVQTEAVQTCAVRTGIDGGTVNLRGCAGVTCGAVVGTLAEGETVTVLTAGEYYSVKTSNGVTGWLAGTRCEVVR
jgi:uncharacterized protein YgiM (DUF1202 family)